MSVWKELGRFLERGTPLLEEAVKSLQDTRALLALLRPTVEALPDLVSDTRGLVGDARALLRELSPLLVDLTRRTLAELRDGQ
ncbi:MAG TPA: hypothetical protein VFV99_10095 [Kofleriaceae bacterium]|nr:hypothetical protein [Kofleriaceae bacterium]